VVTRQRTYVLAALFVIVGVLTTLFLWDVLATVFFAITVAYVLFPLSEWFVEQGLSKRLAATVTTAIAFLAGSLIAVPLGAVLYLRRRDLFTFFQQLPAEIPVTVGEMAYTIDVAALFLTLRSLVTSVAVALAAQTPILALKAVLFAILLYAMLWKPSAPKQPVYRTVPRQYHDVVDRLNDRLRGTLYAIYVLQAATAFGTFLVAWGLFAALGYRGAFALAVVAGILQFIPVVGPSVVVVAMGAAELVAGDTVGAALVLVLGLGLVGFLPDALIRPRLARYTTGMPASLYFVGFTGGVLTLGVVGFIAGPVVVALLLECLNLLADERTTGEQQRF
jgi:predicted PurR-regulated permease PerM